MAISLGAIKNEIAKSGASKGKFLFFKEGSKSRIRFLVDFEDGMEIPFHDSFELGVNVPCQEIFGRECEYCNNQDLRTRNQYAWSVYDYEQKEVKILMAAVNNCSPVPAIASAFESYGTLTDRDYDIRRTGKGQNTTYTVMPMDKMKFRNTKIKAMSDEAIKKALDKAYPADNNELEEDTGKNKKRNTKENTKPKTKVEEQEEDDWDEEEEQENNYEEMTAQELFKLCKLRDIDCKPRKTKQYYIDLLEEDDEENQEDEEQEDDWDEED